MEPMRRRVLCDYVSAAAPDGGPVATMRTREQASGSREKFEVRMIQTDGLTHINLAVRDLGRALQFYEQVFGLREYGRGDGLVHTQAFGRHDIVTSAEDPSTAGLSSGIAHFGFRLVDPGDIDFAVAEVERAGGRLLRRGEFAPGLPYAYVADPDGYEIEIGFE
jgi:catechol 2,3-dioxygenase-like lactoylglutathione lyase family enzyme